MTDAQLEALQPGEVLHYDYRDAAASARDSQTVGETVRVVSWNIERGAHLGGIIAALRQLDADVVLLQELDINCARSGYANVPRELAAALRAECYFVCEFEELDSAVRSPANAVGPLSAAAAASGSSAAPHGRHFHGNAILSLRPTLSDVRVVRHYAPFDWAAKGDEVREPRRGFRSALHAAIGPGERSVPGLPPLHLYCCHFEVFCGALTRARQLADVMDDARAVLTPAVLACMRAWQQKQEEKQQETMRWTNIPAFIIAGDLNTMAHGIVRLSPRYACDRMRVLSLGEPEACWLQRVVLERGMASAGVTRGCCPLSYRFPTHLLARLYRVCVTDNPLVRRLVLGLTADDDARLLNTTLCFYDPSDKAASVTLDNPRYRGLVRGKLDWMLLSHLAPAPIAFPRVDWEAAEGDERCPFRSAATAKALRAAAAKGEESGGWTPPEGYVRFNEDYALSDHMGLAMTVRQTADGAPSDLYPSYGAPYTWSLPHLAWFTATRALLAAGVVLAVRKVGDAIAAAK